MLDVAAVQPRAPGEERVDVYRAVLILRGLHRKVQRCGRHAHLVDGVVRSTWWLLREVRRLQGLPYVEFNALAKLPRVRVNIR